MQYQEVRSLADLVMNEDQSVIILRAGAAKHIVTFLGAEKYEVHLCALITVANQPSIERKNQKKNFF